MDLYASILAREDECDLNIWAAHTVPSGLPIDRTNQSSSSPGSSAKSMSSTTSCSDVSSPSVTGKDSTSQIDLLSKEDVSPVDREGCLQISESAQSNSMTEVQVKSKESDAIQLSGWTSTDAMKHQSLSYLTSEEDPQGGQRQAVPVNLAIRKYCLRQVETPPSTECWWSEREVPSSERFLKPVKDGVQPSLEPNIVKGKWSSKEEYLRCHYNLLKEDTLRPLRNAVKQVRDKSDVNDGRDFAIYQNVYFKLITFSERGLAARIKFSTKRAQKNIRWSQTSRLLQGTLLALSTVDDMFQSQCKLVTVAARPLSGLTLTPPEIDIFFSDPSEIEIDPQQEWIAVEGRTGYFEAYRHSLVALQRMRSEKMPLKKYLIKVQDSVCSIDRSQSFHSDSQKPSGATLPKDRQNTRPTHQDQNSVKASSLDDSQVNALDRILRKEVAIVQGPPGTGKTYVSVAGIENLLRLKRAGDPPIIVASQTNQALDQLLRHVSTFEQNFVRLGSRTTDETVRKHGIYELRQSGQYRASGGLLRQGRKLLATSIHKLQKMLSPLTDRTEPLSAQLFHQLGLLTLEQRYALTNENAAFRQIDSDCQAFTMRGWLGSTLVPMHFNYEENNVSPKDRDIDAKFEELNEVEAENKAFSLSDNDEEQTLYGPSVRLTEPFKTRSVLKSSKDQIDIALKSADLWSIKANLRSAIYKRLQSAAKAIMTEIFRKEAMAYFLAIEMIKTGKWEEDEVYLRQANIIGATTTGLSRYRGLLASLKPKTLFVEEASQSLEAFVAAGCFESVEQLILIGDHKQLRSGCAVPSLETEFNLTISLFERLISNKVEYSMLQMQRRMRPEISKLLQPVYGKLLKDHPSVLNRGTVPGMGGTSCLLFTHEWSEATDSNKSKYNENEAEMIVGFYEYLIYNGVSNREITILTFYNGQRKLLLQKLKSRTRLRTLDFIVATVDSYQGEENTVVLLSLVRGNPGSDLGFVQNMNRITVALSRAKLGLYVFGNMKLLAQQNPLWKRIVSMAMDAKDPWIKTDMPIRCEKHKKNLYIKSPEGWKSINGGCKLPCKGRLRCGHACRLPCHPFDHSAVDCGEYCNRKLPCGHFCRLHCGMQCECTACRRTLMTQGALSLTKTIPKGKVIEAPQARPQLLLGAPPSSGNGTNGPVSGSSQGTRQVSKPNEQSRSGKTQQSIPKSNGIKASPQRKTGQMAAGGRQQTGQGQSPGKNTGVPKATENKRKDQTVSGERNGVTTINVPGVDTSKPIPATASLQHQQQHQQQRNIGKPTATEDLLIDI